MGSKFTAPDICPVCGEDVPRNAKACPECGADERSGWRPDASLANALDLPDAEFDYDEFVAEEFGGGKRRSVTQRTWAMVAVVLLVVLVVLYVMHLW
jgi:predicted nucleic acid-binding Zn ribbon protein